MNKKYGDFLYFLSFDDNGNFNKIENYQNLKEYKIKKCIIYYKIKIKDINLFQNIDYNISYNNFPWYEYLVLNGDLVKKGIKTKDSSWYHWTKYGIKEERTYSYINNSSLHNGRLGNIFFVNMFLNFMSIKYNLNCHYKYSEIFNNLGIYFYKGENVYNINCEVTDENFFHILKNNDLMPCNLILKNVWFQTKEFCKMLDMYFKKDKIKNKVISHNLFNSRYNNNNDLFLHLRLGDVKDITKTKTDYYEKILDNIYYNKGFISSDSINDPYCLNLINKYDLEVVNYNETNTIMFASTCNNIILSGGSFSWLIGFLAFFSKNIYYPNLENKWYGDIFSFSNWIEL
jgi:hypothetical protein